MLTTPHIHKSHFLFKEDLADLHRFDRIQNARNRLTLIYPIIKYIHGLVIIFQLMNPNLLTNTLHMQKHESIHCTGRLRFIYNEINEWFHFVQQIYNWGTKTMITRWIPSIIQIVTKDLKAHLMIRVIILLPRRLAFNIYGIFSIPVWWDIISFSKCPG